jgi:ribosomal protein L22
MASGRYPITASAEILAIIENAETNAQQKGLNTSRMALVHLSTQKASRPMHPGRKRGRSMKRSHIEVVLGEAPEKEKKKGRREGSRSQKDNKEAKNAEKRKEESK